MQAENHDANSAIRQLALFLRILLVRVEGLEPTHLAALDPKSSDYMIHKNSQNILKP